MQLDKAMQLGKIAESLGCTSVDAAKDIVSYEGHRQVENGFMKIRVSYSTSEMGNHKAQIAVTVDTADIGELERTFSVAVDRIRRGD
jgi:hypothetical protein